MDGIEGVTVLRSACEMKLTVRLVFLANAAMVRPLATLSLRMRAPISIECDSLPAMRIS
jgi:hypothetical protein